uniref:Claudin n=1 Tax=Cyprinus carpio TaxID=7962 RepID=A0A8C1KR36_CYPCA
MGNMATEIIAFLLTISGWILISSTLPTDYWKVSSVDGTVITTATFWSNLWKTCVTDSTGVSNCKDFPSMLALDGTLLLPSNIFSTLESLMEDATFIYSKGIMHHWQEYSYNGATSVISTRTKITKMGRNPETPQKDLPDQSFSGRQFGRNAYV